LPAAAQARRAGHSVAALQALDQCWALLARWRLATQAGTTADATQQTLLLDEADRLTANLAYHLAARRALADEPEPSPTRREPHL
ncbi:MAG: hypothetical protein K2X55_28515, partial [Burkholderiaceae bacterium]|nr:hypothetical protein [Burkholderiaceae bacterium]